MSVLLRGVAISDDEFWASATELLAEERLWACCQIDAAAEAARLRYITPGAGQAGTYLLKAQRAREFAAAGYSGSVPALVQAKVTAAGLTPQQAAELIIVTADAWEAKAAEIEQVRESGKKAVAEAVDMNGINAAQDSAVAALATL